MKWIKASERLPEKDGFYIADSDWIGDAINEIVPNDRSDTNFLNGKFECGKNWRVTAWLDESSPSDNTQIRDGWVRVQDGLPPLVEGQDYSENVIAWLDGERKIMNYAILPDDYNNLCYAWCMVYNGLDGDAEFDDNYYPSHWQPLPTPPND